MMDARENKEIDGSGVAMGEEGDEEANARDPVAQSILVKAAVARCLLDPSPSSHERCQAALTFISDHTPEEQRRMCRERISEARNGILRLIVQEGWPLVFPAGNHIYFDPEKRAMGCNRIALGVGPDTYAACYMETCLLQRQTRDFCDRHGYANQGTREWPDFDSLATEIRRLVRVYWEFSTDPRVSAPFAFEIGWSDIGPDGHPQQQQQQRQQQERQKRQPSPPETSDTDRWHNDHEPFHRERESHYAEMKERVANAFVGFVVEDTWNQGWDAFIKKSRGKHMEAVRLIADHPVFEEQKEMLSQVLGEPDISDEDAAVTIYLYIRGKSRFTGTEQVFEKEHWDRHSRCAEGVCREGGDFEERFDANAFVTLSNAMSDCVCDPPSEYPLWPIDPPRVTASSFEAARVFRPDASGERLLTEMLWGGASAGDTECPSVGMRNEAMEYGKGLEETAMAATHERGPPDVEH